MTPHEMLNLPIKDSDLGNTTIAGYLEELLSALWHEREGFNGKRPFGNSGWEGDLYRPLVEHGLVDGVIDEEGWIAECDAAAADRLIAECIAAAFKPRWHDPHA